MKRAEWICLISLLVGIVLFNHSVDILLLPMKTLRLKAEYIVCLFLGLFFSSTSIIYILYQKKLLDQLSCIIIVFDVCMMPVFEYMGIPDLLWWVILVLFPSLGILVLKKRLRLFR